MESVSYMDRPLGEQIRVPLCYGRLLALFSILMSVSLSQIQPLTTLYSSALLLPPPFPRYKSNPGLLDRVSLYKGDITTLCVDAIVNSTNSQLAGGGGVDDAIRRAAGLGLIEECRSLNGCRIGDARITEGYRLPAKHVIHTAGPIYSREDNDKHADRLATCYRRSLEVAVGNSLRHIAFPSISTGSCRYPIKHAAHIALDVIRRFLEVDNQLERVVLVVYTEEDWDVYRNGIGINMGSFRSLLGQSMEWRFHYSCPLLEASSLKAYNNYLPGL
ncbi:hypothetical protein BXZ70DRAFT_134062 [Cristinia sonorae]|uniref:Macro domain-containing protein n=1 Tax=Cristinia sonorae TaxID=1940300 RepID=A0A8K0UR63_9AGAR|nr:hypothetical protein BXZ70DRAFT_134062 [Cristinia sonorae]